MRYYLVILCIMCLLALSSAEFCSDDYEPRVLVLSAESPDPQASPQDDLPIDNRSDYSQLFTYLHQEYNYTIHHKSISSEISIRSQPNEYLYNFVIFLATSHAPIPKATLKEFVNICGSVLIAPQVQIMDEFYSDFARDMGIDYIESPSTVIDPYNTVLSPSNKLLIEITVLGQSKTKDQVTIGPHHVVTVRGTPMKTVVQSISEMIDPTATKIISFIRGNPSTQVIDTNYNVLVEGRKLAFVTGVSPKAPKVLEDGTVVFQSKGRVIFASSNWLFSDESLGSEYSDENEYQNGKFYRKFIDWLCRIILHTNNGQEEPPAG